MAMRVRRRRRRRNTMQTDSYARQVAVDGAARPVLHVEGISG